MKLKTTKLLKKSQGKKSEIKRITIKSETIIHDKL